MLIYFREKFFLYLCGNLKGFMENIIGRKKEIKELKELFYSGKAEFVAIYGRRRIGKTFLIDEALKGKITFRHAGLSPVDEANDKNNSKNQL